MDWQEPLGQRLYELRHAQRLTLKRVARDVHMNISDLSKLERAQRPSIPFATILRLATYYGVTLDGLYVCCTTSSDQSY